MIDPKKIKIIFIIIFSVIIIAGVALAVFWLVGKFKPAAQPVASVTHYSEDIVLMEKATQEKNPSYCDQLKETSKNDCLYGIADMNNEAKFCDLIQDAALNKKCQELILSRQAIDSQDPKKCLSLTVAEIKNDCLGTIFRQQHNLNYCQGFDQEVKTLCEDIINTNLAFSAKDPTICAKIQTANNKINCESAIATIPKDSDGDGVPDYLERSYGTDPFNPQSK